MLLSASSIRMLENAEKVRQFTRNIEFDYVDWTIKAIGEKFNQSAVGIQDYLPAGASTRIVREYIRSQRAIQQLDAEINIIYADPNIKDKNAALKPVMDEREKFTNYQHQLAPVAESALQNQISQVLVENGLSFFGQPVPPVLFHSTPLPLALIVSPRDRILQEANISLLTDMTAEEKTKLEDSVMAKLDVSALIVPIGGVGIYPTMVMATSDLEYLTDTISHEWTHNFLTLRPLGLNYDTSPELRTINETTASIVGSEIGKQVMMKYYSDLLPPDIPDTINTGAEADSTEEVSEPELEPFNYRKEMHSTRTAVDELLKQGKITDAEKYMEERRKLFWENGYAIRRLNQAYFAFYGAYADSPVGAAGKDPVGPVVRALRKQSGSLSEFLEKISRVTSFDQLKSVVTIPVNE